MGNSAYFIASTDLNEFSPHEREEAKKIDRFLSKFIQVIVDSTGNHPDGIQEDSITIDNFPCKTFESDLKDTDKEGHKIKGVFCLAENRFYTVFMLGETESVNQNSERFLKSFTIEQ